LTCPCAAGPEDARFKRLSKLEGAQGDSKSIAKQISCDLCTEASRSIAETLNSRKFKSEEAVLEIIGELCAGTEGHDSIDFVLERGGWSVTSTDEGYRMAKDVKKSDEADLMGGFALRDSMKQACILTVDEHQSELSEWLFLQIKKGKAIDAEVVGHKLCTDLARSCKKAGGSKSSGRKSNKEL